MRNIPPRVSKELLPWVQVTPCHLHNSVNLPRHLLHSTLHLLLGGDGLGHLYQVEPSKWPPIVTVWAKLMTPIVTIVAV